MKKSISILLCIIMIAVTFSSCKFIKTKDTETNEESAKTTESTTGTAKDGETEASTKKDSDKSSDSDTDESFTVYVTDKNGEYVTNKNGEYVTEAIDVEALGEQLEKEIEKQSTTKSGSSSSSSGTIGDVQSSEEDLLPEGTKTKDTTLMKTKVTPVLKSGTYTIDGSIKASGQSIDATIAFKNNGKDFSIIAAMMGFEIRAFSSNGKYYLAVPMLRKYAEVSEDEIGDLSEMTESFKASDAKYVKTTTVKDGKVTYTCEEYTLDSDTVKYYFNSKGEWKRMEIIEGDDILVWEIDSFSDEAADSLFAINKSWKKDDTLLGGTT